MALFRRLPFTSVLQTSTNHVNKMQSIVSRSYASTSEPVYVVFGATGGIGSALCRRLAQQPGASITAIARDSSKLDALAAELSPRVAITTLTADVTDSKQVDAAMSAVSAAHGYCTGMAHCVGSIVLKPAHQTSDEDFENCLRLNLSSAFFVLRAAVKIMMQSDPKGGSIALVSSAVARHGISNHEAVAAAKAGLGGLVLSAAATYAPHNIRVNAVAPGLTRTPLAARILRNPAALKASEGMHALKRVGEADEVASALEFLLNPSNSFITGQTLGVDGGLGSLKPQ